MALAENTAILDVAYAVDEGYVRQLATSLTSLVKYCVQPDRLRVTVLHDGIATRLCGEIAASLPDSLDLRFLPIERGRLANMPLPTRISPWITSMSFARLLLPDLLPETERILYLDADTVVLGDILGLGAMKLDGAPLAAAVDPFIPTWGSYGGVQNATLVEGREDTLYFNSGVLLIDASGWRAVDLAGVVMAYAEREGAGILLGDQEALNAVVAGNFVKLDPVWNTSAFHLEQLPSPEFEVKLAHTRILQYLGERKPWHEHAEPRRVDLPFLDHAPRRWSELKARP